MSRILSIVLSILVVLVVLAASCFFVVDQRQYGVIMAMGQIRSVVTDPGLHIKLPPPFENIIHIDKRLLLLEGNDSEPMLTAEKQRVVVDWYVRWRITNPTQYIRNVGLTVNSGSVQLNRVVRSAFQTEINRSTVKDFLSTKWDVVRDAVKSDVIKSVTGSTPWGVEIVDVRVTRVGYTEAITESVYRRMEAERKRVANELRSTGAADGEKIRADADKKREIILADAYKEAQVTKGLGDAQASHIYGSAFGKDQKFAEFYQSLESYRSAFNKGEIMVINPEQSQFFKVFRDGAVISNGKK
jgi:modulator of FtsH protease HflC